MLAPGKSERRRSTLSLMLTGHLGQSQPNMDSSARGGEDCRKVLLCLAPATPLVIIDP